MTTVEFSTLLKRSSIIALIIASVAVFAIFIQNFQVTPNQSEQLQVVFPFAALRADEQILTPSNTESTFEYYLLENLGVGLVRDDLTNPEGYAPILASSWETDGDSTWTFKIRKNLQWSDGTEITGNQLARHFTRLKASSSRHLTQLKLLDKIYFDEKRHALVLKFSHKIGIGILHELSLADAVLVHPTKKDWSITSGPYLVRKYDHSGKELLLEINPHCPLYSDLSPKHVRLFPLKSLSELDLLFKSLKVDLFYLPQPTFRQIYSQAIGNAPHSLRGQKTIIHFIVFNDKVALSKDERARKELSYLIGEAFSKAAKNDFYEYYGQMVPQGYTGQLAKIPPVKTEIKALVGQDVSINFHPAIKEIPGILEALAENFKKDVA